MKSNKISNHAMKHKYIKNTNKSRWGTKKFLPEQDLVENFFTNKK